MYLLVQLCDVERSFALLDLAVALQVYSTRDGCVMNNHAIYQKAKTLIPGGTHLLGKRPEMYAPNRWPPYYKLANGCEVVDLDGRSYLDFTMNGIGSCLLGFAHPAVTAAVVHRV